MERSYNIPDGDQRERIISSPIEEAMHDVLGGVPKAADALKVSRQAIHSLLNSGFSLRKATALKIAKATRDAGREVSAAELLGVVPWNGPERHDGGGNGNGRRGRIAEKRAPRSAAAPPARAERAQLRAEDAAPPRMIRLGERQGRRCVERIITRRYSAPRRQVAA